MRQTLIKTALGQRPADLLLKNLQLVQVLTGEILPAEVAVVDGFIAYVGVDYCVETGGSALETMDLGGAYLSPALIDSHCHVESSMVTPAIYCSEALRWGVTTFITDPHEIANVIGLEGVQFMLDSVCYLPVRYYVQLPSCVPAVPFEHAGAVLTAEKLSSFVKDPRVLGLGEMMDFPGVAACDPEVMEKLSLFSDGVLDGHAPALSGSLLQAYVSAGIETDHESSSWPEAHEKLRAGMAVLIREGSAGKNLEAILTGVLAEGIDTRQLAFCTDDKHLSDIRREGTIRYHVKKAVEMGMDPVTALQLGSINAARIYRLRKLGAIAPGYHADMIVLKDLHSFEIERVFAGGKWMDGASAPASPSPMMQPSANGINPGVLHSVNLAPLCEADFAIPEREQQPVIQIQRGQINTSLSFVKGNTAAGLIVTGRLRKIAVVERHHATGQVGVGLLSGYGLRHGAIATTVAHDSHNMIVVGDNDADMLIAARELERIQGGYTIVRDGQVLGSLPLPVAGLMSTLSADAFIRALDQMLVLARQEEIARGIDPFITLSFMALPVIPEVRITDQGVFDVGTFSFIV